MESVCFAPFLLVLLLSISGEEQDSEWTIKLSNGLSYGPIKCLAHKETEIAASVGLFS